MANLVKKAIIQCAKAAGYDLKVSRVSCSVPQNKVAFIHLAKCGGISIDNALREQLAQPGERKIVRSPIIASSLHKFGKEIKNIDDACEFGEYHINTLQDILLYHLNLSWHYVSGHLAVNQKLLNNYHSQYKFVTVMRNPIERFKSNYIFNKLTNQLAIMPPCINENTDLIKEANEIVFGKRGWQMANMQTAFLVGRYPQNQQDACNMQAEFSHNIKQFTVVGVLEDLSTFTTRCKTTLNIDLNIKKRNQTNTQLTKKQLNTQSELLNYFNEPKVQKKLTELTQFEMQNYQNVVNNNER